MASAIPVLPEVASTKVSPGLMRPFCSASAIMLMAGLQERRNNPFETSDRTIGLHVRPGVMHTCRVRQKNAKAQAHLSFTLPAGLFPSSFARMTFEEFVLKRCSRTRGVFPTKSSTVGYSNASLADVLAITCNCPIRPIKFCKSIPELCCLALFVLFCVDTSKNRIEGRSLMLERRHLMRLV